MKTTYLAISYSRMATANTRWKYFLLLFIFITDSSGLPQVSKSVKQQRQSDTIQIKSPAPTANTVVKPYEYEYLINDTQSGNFFGHSESSDGQVVRGQYHVLLPDGRYQTVTYTADAINGYRPTVTYTHQPQNGSLNSVPVLTNEVPVAVGSKGPCDPNPCGPGNICEVQGGAGLCKSDLKAFFGDRNVSSSLPEGPPPEIGSEVEAAVVTLVTNAPMKAVAAEVDAPAIVPIAGEKYAAITDAPIRPIAATSKTSMGPIAEFPVVAPEAPVVAPITPVLEDPIDQSPKVAVPIFVTPVLRFSPVLPFTPVLQCSGFQCASGECIDADYKCDDDTDCADGSDESNCPPPVLRCNGFQCASGECIDADYKCDDDNDCTDGSDESNCPAVCGGFQCANGECIDADYKCNDDTDCADGSDESNCYPTEPLCGGFQCANGECRYNAADECDGFTDCADGSDESNCLCGGFQCANGECRYNAADECNGFPDCDDGSDETNCYTIESLCGGFQCANGECRYNAADECDGFSDCADGSDESNC